MIQIRQQKTTITTFYVFIAFIATTILPGILLSPIRAEERAIEDTDITAAVEAALLQDGSVSSHWIDIETKDGIVTLSGTVDNLRSKDRAPEIAERVKGVRSVVNQIKVKPMHREDHELRYAISMALHEDPATESYDIQIEVNDGIATLKGVVESWQEKLLAVEVAKGVKGVNAIEDQMQIEVNPARPDSEIEADIERRLESDIWVDDLLIDVKVKDGIVTLSGAVGSAAEKTRATSDARVFGVRGVDNNGLKVQWWARDKMRRKKSPSKTDAAVKEAVEDAFRYDPRVSTFTLNPKVKDGTVTLTGMVDNLAAKKAAERDAKNTVGVRRVKNHLKVRPPDFPSDDEIIRRVERALNRDPDLQQHDIEVISVNGKVFLLGRVDSNYEISLAEEISTRVKGVIDLANRLKVEDSWNMEADWNIKLAIEEELFWSTDVDSDNILVAVNEGVAILTGEVDTWREWRAATAEAYDGGAKSVRNLLKIKENSAADLQ